MLEKFNELGKKYGRLTVVERAGNYKDGSAMWYCLCDCGNPNKIKVRATSLRVGHTISCGCYVVEKTIAVHSGKVLTDEHKKLISKANKESERFDSRSKIGKKYPKRGRYKRGSLIVRKINGLINNARKRDIPVTISKETLADLMSKPCYYCGKESNIEGYRQCTGIDRKDNNQGYTEENCVSCCFYCNSCKNNRTFAEFKDHVANMYKTLYCENKER